MPCLKPTPLRMTLFLVILSVVLGACSSAPLSQHRSGTPTGIPTTRFQPASSTPSPTVMDFLLPTVTHTTTILPSLTFIPSPTPIPSPTAISAPAGWKLVWHDEFNGAAGNKPDPAYWSYDLGAGGWGNNELQYYTDRAENASLDGKGSLVIRAIRYADPKASRLDCATCLYSSARLVTRERREFTYGLFEARIRLPAGQGLWPAFWLLGANVGQVGWPQSGEIDVMENKGSEPSRVHGSLHGPGYSTQTYLTHIYALTNGRFTDDFHVFAVEWSSTEIRWYVDGLQFFSVAKSSVSNRWVFDHPFYLIINLAIGGDFSGAPGHSTTFPQSLLVDYVRVYQK